MSNNQTIRDAVAPPYYIATYEGRTIGVKRDDNYEKSIPKLRSANIQDIFVSSTLPEYGDTLVQIGEEMWPDVIDLIKNVNVTYEAPNNVGHDMAAGPIIQGNRSQKLMRSDAQTAHLDDRLSITSPDPSDLISIAVHTTSQRTLKFNNLRLSTIVKDVKSLIETELGVPAALQSLDLLGKPLLDAMTLGHSGVTSETPLDLSLNTRRTMIYFYPFPTCGGYTAENVKVQIWLNRSWELAALGASERGSLKDNVQSRLKNIRSSLGAETFLPFLGRLVSGLYQLYRQRLTQYSRQMN
ncbi:hypothetical protein FRC07_000232 [Ceratobasidium sp. 392]|nr:hypothetical protein FRC07_000232 [Ceratobasidium sp. 392]